MKAVHEIGLRVRPAHLGDAEALIALEHAAFGAAAWGGDAVADGLTATGVHGLVAEMDPLPLVTSRKGAMRAPVICGFALWRDLDSEAEILTFGVDPGYRRQGIARAMLSKLIDDAAGIGAARLFLEVAQSNAPAIALYQLAGFEVISRRAHYYRSGDDALVMRLAL